MPDITGLILAGGRGERLGGVDKGLVQYRGRPLIEHVVERFTPQVQSILISANRNLERYAAIAEIVTDADACVQTEAFAGPLVGMLAGLRRATSEWLAIVPCDAPHLPLDLVRRLAHARTGSIEAAYVRTGSMMQPAFALIRTAAANSLSHWLSSGSRAVHAWLLSLDSVAVDFDDEHAFANINTLADIRR